MAKIMNSVMSWTDIQTDSQPSYTASSEQAPIHFTAENSISGTQILRVIYDLKNKKIFGLS
jgi:hypothetical protein